MKIGQITLLYISIIILFVLTIISEYGDINNIFVGVASVLAILIPAIYSVIPLIEDLKLRKNKSKNRLSENTFTDREEDLNHIIQKLSTKEHIIEITGEDESCGKTWIAKKLVDYINHPRDFNSKKCKFSYKIAHYIDLELYNDRELEAFFEKNIINSKVVLIFDNVINISFILSKQSMYHFQLIYILKEPSEDNFFKYSISRFHENHIKELQDKIRCNFPGIENINEKEIHILYNLTNGNIGKIYSVLSKQTSIKWLKDIAIGNRTEYDEKLDSIKLNLFTGKYEIARKELDIFASNNKQYFLENNDLYYKYILMKADCEHLLNNYEEALSLLSIIEARPYCSNNTNYELELYKAHYYKHLWKCNDSLDVLHKIMTKSYSAKVDSMGILLAKYFIDDLYVPYNDETSLHEFYNIYIDAKNSNMDIQDSNNVLKHKRCAAIFLYYKNKPSNPDELIKSINSVIEIYKSQNNRLLANAYFIRGEINRIYGKYQDAINDYSHCLCVTYDRNIIIQTNLMVYYLIKCKDIDIKFELLSLNEIIELCQHNAYAKKIYQRINSILLNDPYSDDIVNCFDTRIMPIL